MDFSKVKDIFKKENFVKALEFIRQHARYFTAGALFIVLVLVLVNCSDPVPKETGESVGDTEIMEETEEAFEVDAYQEVNDLITQYYAAYVSGDMETLTTLATPVSENEQAYITLFCQYVESYENIICYTKSGLEEGSYLVYVSLEVKFTGIDTVAPGLDFFYVRTAEDGTLYIDNLYSQYNLAKKENALDTSVQSLMQEFINQEDALALHQETQDKYDEALASDEALETMINTTIPEAINEWVVSIAQASTESTETTEAPEEADTETPEETDTGETTDETGDGETSDEPEETTQETVYTTDTVNVRAEADTSSEKLGTVSAGTVLTRTGTDGEWSIVEYNGSVGYIKSEYLSTDDSATLSEEETDASTAIAEGTVVTLQNTVNIRSGMSETSDRIGTAYAGEKVTVIMSYAEGWTKVTWNSKTGYIKTSLLQ